MTDSLYKAYKTALQTYLQSETGIAWDSYADSTIDPVGGVRIYQVLPRQSNRGMIDSDASLFQFELRVLVAEYSVNAADSLLLDWVSLARAAMKKLKKQGTTIAHPDYKSPTAFKGIELQEIRLPIDQDSLGEQRKTADDRYLGTGLLYYVWED